MSFAQELQNGPQPAAGGDQLCAAESRLSLPLELLAGEWLSNQRGEGAEETTYLMDSLLPTLVLGMEKLLTEVFHASTAEHARFQNASVMMYIGVGQRTGGD